MSQREIIDYVSNFLARHCDDREFLEDVVHHGIYNLTVSVIDGDSDSEYDAISSEFENQSRDLLKKLDAIEYDERQDGKS